MKFQHNGKVLVEIPQLHQATSQDVLCDNRSIGYQQAKYTLKSLKYNFQKIKNDWLGTGGGVVLREGVFWVAFMTYIFPWMLDIAKVYCAIRIAMAFYEEKRGGRDGATGFQALIQYGKWYLVFWLIPWGVELIDQIGSKMLEDLTKTPLQ